MNLLKFEEKIGVNFKNKDLLKQAFTHRSYLNENPSLSLRHNERLEFFGDAVLELIVTEYLFKAFSEKAEGEMTAIRASLVNANTLSKIAEEINMDDFILLSKGERKSVGKAKQYIMANAFEAVVGAIYLERGYAKAAAFLKKYLLGKTKDIIEKKLWVDAKSFFQEKAQETENITPSYKVLAESGPDHEKIFTVGVFLADKPIAEGKGSSKQEAEQDAAARGLSAKKWQVK